ncbi:flagellar M-ring protein FliF [Alkalibaculum sp. M08DMB]|uniref:Flagellar M-ring protein n=1 Tax=Alkalibaculum sporogenes TaxID=2655001 RepID=A0A6A7K626_9FIRM|nr:flagellar basal-body MS-ring/collar protein FliF [Alkalibaculum sporogenes]MPW24791.1 flagellar M-ring protein FliF [Alkalibaculum sporogenes]
MDRVTVIIDGVKNGWNKMDKKKRITMIVLICSILLFVSIFTYSTQNKNYVTLFNNLEPEDAGNIVSDLEAKKISYKLENDGRAILIDEALIDKYRLELAMGGMMPQNSLGFEIFDDMGLMVTDDDRKIMYQRALTGELQRSIMSLDAINSAKVHLVMSEKSIFETEQKQASASVVLDIKPSNKVTDDMIRGVAALVSGAVENLPEKNIQVIDSKGNLLSRDLQKNDGFSATDVMNEYNKVIDEFESKIESNLNELLGTAYGRDKIKVSVFADLDFDSEESTIITYENPVIRSEQVTATGGDINVEQVTGGNIDDNVGNVIDNNNGGGSTFDRTVNNELTTETTTTIKAPGKVNRLTTSVVYDGNINDENAATIRNIVATATGYDINRGDLISVEGVVFDTTYEEELQAQLDAIRLEEERNRSLLDKYGEYMVFGLLLILVIVILVALVRILLGKKKTQDDKAQGELAIDLVTPEVAVEEDLNIEVKTDNNKAKAQNYAKEHPDLAADLIKAWVKE